MNVLITAGPTFEPLDSVRRLTNFSTGRLGTELAAFFADQGHSVFLLRGAGCTWPASAKWPEFGVFTTASSLSDRFEQLSRQKVDVIFHTAAVCDFAFGQIVQKQSGAPVSAGKISTALGALAAELIPVPKILAQLRRWFPDALLAGWKFEVDGDQSTALAKAREQIQANQTDACVANGPAYGEGFGFVAAREEVLHLPDRASLFHALLEWTERMK